MMIPALYIFVAYSGILIVSYPLLFKRSDTYDRPVVFPAQGPPVKTIFKIYFLFCVLLSNGANSIFDLGFNFGD